MINLAHIARHDLVWADDIGSVIEPLRLAGNLADADLLQAWTGAGRPFVISRQPEGLPEGVLAAGLPLPPAQGKRRLAIHLPKAAITGHRTPLRLAETIEAAPVAWAVHLSALLSGESLPDLHVFGSLAWQAITGMDYVGPSSDLDLSWDARQASVRDHACTALGHWQQASGIPVDGELRFSGGRAVSLREWIRVAEGGGGVVLVKALRETYLCDVGQLIEETAPC